MKNIKIINNFFAILILIFVKTYFLYINIGSLRLLRKEEKGRLIMNISKISFGAAPVEKYDNLDVPEFVQRGHSRQVAGQYERSPRTDEYRPSQAAGGRHKKHGEKPVQGSKQNKHKTSILSPRRPINAIIYGTVLGLVIPKMAAMANQPAATVTVPLNPAYGIVELAERYNCDLDAIYAFNGLTPYSDMSQVESIKIPTMYSNVQDEIDSLQEQLFNKKLTAEERSILESRISQLQDKKVLQDAIATVYTDGKCVYYHMNEFDENTPQWIREKYPRGVNVEEFKLIFDIKDKAIKNNNKIGYSWGYNSEYGGYMDFTHNMLVSGTDIKVPVSAVRTGNNIITGSQFTAGN